MFNIGQYWTSGTGRLSGGTTLFTIPAGGGVPSGVFATPPCGQVSDAAYDPRGGAFVAINSVCLDSAKEGVWLYPLSGGSPTQIAGPSQNQVNPVLDPPSWARDGSGFLFVGSTATTVAGAQVNANVGLLYVTSSGAIDVLIPVPAANDSIDSVTVSADGNFVAFALRDTTAVKSDIYVVDLRTQDFVTWAATTDGMSKEPRF